MDELQSAIHRLLKRFVSRQVLALRAIEEMRPAKMFMRNNDYSVQKYIEANEVSANFPTIGYTGENNEWQYFFHGAGCRLTHTITQEPVEWDAPDVNAFDSYWFVNWLEWLLNYEATGEDATIVRKAFDSYGGTFREFVFAQTQGLEKAGLVAPSGQPNWNKYTLT